MADGPFDVDGVAELSIAFTVAGVPTDPTTVTLTVADPDGNKTAYTGGQLTHSGAGAYRVTVPVTKAGQWRWRWVGTGAAAGAKQGSFLVRTKVPA